VNAATIARAYVAAMQREWREDPETLYEILFTWDASPERAVRQQLIDGWNETWEDTPRWLRDAIGVSSAEVRSHLRKAAPALAAEGLANREVQRIKRADDARLEAEATG